MNIKNQDSNNPLISIINRNQSKVSNGFTPVESKFKKGLLDCEDGSKILTTSLDLKNEDPLLDVGSICNREGEQKFNLNNKTMLTENNAIVNHRALTTVLDTPIVSNHPSEIFLEALGKGTENFTFSCFCPNRLAINEFGSFRKLKSRLKELNGQGYNIYVTVQETTSEERKAEDIGRVRALFIDLDNPGELPKFHLKPSMIVESSPKKYHCYWLLNDWVKLSPEKYKEEISTPLIKHYKADLNCKDLPRVMRLPGFINNKAEHNQPVVNILEINDLRYSLEEITNGITDNEYLPEKQLTVDFNDLSIPVEIENKSSNNPIDDAIEVIKNLSKGMMNVGLNEACFTLGSMFYNNEEELKEATKRIHQIVTELENSGKWESLKKTRTTIEKAFKDGAREGHKKGNKDKESNHYKLKAKVLTWLETFDIPLAWNEMSMQMELDGEQKDSTTLHQDFMDYMNYDSGKQIFEDMIVVLAKKNSYHPVEKWLYSLAPFEESLEGIELDDYANDHFELLFTAMNLHDKAPIQKEMVKKWLIACIARALDPGCKVDNTLILKGRTQGQNKTTFFSTLFGEFFQTAGSHKSEPDELLALQAAWVSEYGEIESTFDKKGISKLKEFLTKQHDTFRIPYGRTSQKVLRRFILCGTTNEDEFLSDATGNRRYWIIDIDKKIDLELIKCIKEELFRCLLSIYKHGIIGEDENGIIYTPELWWFGEKEEDEIKELTKESEQSDMLEDMVLQFLQHQEYVSMVQILEKLKDRNFELPPNRSSQTRIGNILKRAGIAKPKQLTINLVRTRYYRWDAYWDEQKAKHEESKKAELLILDDTEDEPKLNVSIVTD